MGELQPFDAESKKAAEPIVEADPLLKSRVKLQELLRPPEEVADRMRTYVTKAAAELLESHPDAEMKRIVENASGVYLWEHMAHDTGASLPVGLIYEPYRHSGFHNIYFDNRFLSRDEYEYFINALKQRGITDAVLEEQRKHRESQKEDIAQTMESFLKNSVLAEYFATYTIPALEQTSPRPLNQYEEAAKRAQLEDGFRRRWGPALDGMPLESALASMPEVRIDYAKQVEARVHMETVDRGQTDSHKRGTDPARERFRKRITDRFRNGGAILGARNMSEEEIANIHVRDGKFWIQKEESDTSHEPVGWKEGFIPDHEVFSLNSSPYFSIPHFASVGLQVIGPRLYDHEDRRSFTEIVDEGYRIAGQELAQELIRPNGKSLLEYWNTDHAILWMQQVRGPVVTAEEKPHLEHTGWRPYFNDYTINRLDSAADVSWNHRITLGTALYASPEIAEGPPRQADAVRRDLDLPVVPQTKTDLVLDIQGIRITPHSRTEAPDDFDLSITGLKLVARDGTRLYYVKDAEESARFEPVQDEINYVRRLNVAAFSEAIGMTKLSENIVASDGLTVAGLVDLLKQNVQYAVPDKSDYSRLQTVEQWGQQVNDDGILLGQSTTFAEFTQRVLKMVYPKDYTLAENPSIASWPRCLLYKGRVDATPYMPVSLWIPEKGIDAIIDIAPDPEELFELAGSFPYPPSNDTASDSIRRLHTVDTHHVNVLASKEYKKLLDQRAGQILFAEPEVFAAIQQRLFSKVIRDESVLDSLSPKEFAAVALRIRSNDNALADDTHDPHIAGMKLVARRGNEYDFIIDPESTDYKPVDLVLPRQRKNDIAIICEQIGMTNLAQIIKDRDTLTVEGLRRLVKWHSKAIVPRDEGFDYILRNTEDFALLVNEEGILEGQCKTFELFMRKLLTTVYGQSAVRPESGMTLVNTAPISRMTHVQTRLQLPEEGVEALIDVEPALADIQGLDPEAPIVHDQKQPLEDLLRDIEVLAQAMSRDTSAAPDEENLEKPADDANTVHTDTPASAPQKSTPPPRREQALKELPEKEIHEITLPVPEPPAEDTTNEEVERMLAEKALDAASTKFRQELSLVLGLPNTFPDQNTYHEQIMKKLAPVLNKGEDIWRNTLHVQLYVLLQNYRVWDYAPYGPEGKSPFDYPQEDVDRVERWINHYKDRSSGVWPMVRKGTFPNYDPAFLQTMEQVVHAFNSWHKTHSPKAA